MLGDKGIVNDLIGQKEDQEDNKMKSKWTE